MQDDKGGLKKKESGAFGAALFLGAHSAPFLSSLNSPLFSRLFSPFPMKCLMDLSELAVGHVGVDLGCLNIGVAEHGLHAS